MRIRRGFTLIELLVVVAIVAILAGILLAVFSGAKREAEHTSCAANIHNLGAAIVLYANDHDGWVPPATTEEAMFLNMSPRVPGATTAAVEASPAVLRKAMAPYVKSEAVWFCPVDRYAHENVLYLSIRHQLSSYFFWPHTPGTRTAWPPKMQLGQDPPSGASEGVQDVPMLSDAVGIPAMDSQPGLNDDRRARSNHPDNYADAIRQDLSLMRKPAKVWMGTLE